MRNPVGLFVYGAFILDPYKLNEVKKDIGNEVFEMVIENQAGPKLS